MIRKSFVLHNDSLNILDELTDEQAGMLFRAIKAHQFNEITDLDILTKVALKPFTNQFERDNLKYQSIVERNKSNGSKGGRPTKPKTTQTNPKQPSGLIGNPDEPKQPDSVSVNESDSDSVSDNDNVKDKEKITPVKLDYSVLQMSDLQCKDVVRIRRKNKGTTLTQLIINQLAKQFFLAQDKGFSLQDSLIEWEVRGWKSFKAEWMKSENKPNDKYQRDIQALQEWTPR